METRRGRLERDSARDARSSAAVSTITILRVTEVMAAEAGQLTDRLQAVNCELASFIHSRVPHSRVPLIF